MTKPRNPIDKTAIINYSVYGAKALTDAAMLGQKPRTIAKPQFDTPVLQPTVLKPNVAPFRAGAKAIKDESAAARRGVSESGSPEFLPTIMAGTMKALSDLNVAESGHLTEVSNINAASEAETASKQSVISSGILNEAEKLRLDMQTKENLITTQANAETLNSLQTSVAQLGLIGTQKQQSIFDLMYLNKFI